LERDGYAIEKVIFESRPQFYVTANLYLPQPATRHPAILFPCGHDSNGKAAALYQTACLGLVKKGYVVLIYDPLGQGERSQYVDPETGRSRVPVGTSQHSYDGNRLELLGYNLANFRIWDGIRALDYLLSRPEVDARRVGVTGNSGGGTLTTYLIALEDRLKVAVPGCYITTFRHRLETRIPADAEQNFIPIIKNHLDHADLLGLAAPRPVMIAAAIHDFFPLAGARETYAQLRTLYAKLGVEERVGMVEADAKHGFTKPLREGMYGWMNRWLGVDATAEEPPGQVEPEANLQCTETGQVLTSLGGVTVYDLTQRLAEDLIPVPPSLPTRAEVEAYQARIRVRMREVLALSAPDNPLEARTVERREGNGYLREKVVFSSQPDILVPALLFRPRKLTASGRAVVYVAEFGKEQEAKPGGEIEALVRAGDLVLAIDVRGVGETKSQVVRRGDYYHIYGTETELTYTSWMIGRPLFGMRVTDVLRAVEYLRGRKEAVNRPLAVYGVGAGALLALCAAALDQHIAEVHCREMLVSYRNFLATPVPRFHCNILVPRLLRHFDLPEVAIAIAPRALVLCRTVDARREPLPRQAVLRTYRPTVAAFERLEAAEAFRVE